MVWVRRVWRRGVVHLVEVGGGGGDGGMGDRSVEESCGSGEGSVSGMVSLSSTQWPGSMPREQLQ